MDFPGEKLVIRLWETVADKGVGNLFKPWQMRREGRASIELKRDELLAIAQAECDAELIRKGEYLPSFVRAANAHSASISQSVGEAVIAESIRREVNVTRALFHAEDSLSSEEQSPPEEKVDDDWLYRWRDSASAVSSEELQNLWGRVLAGEVKAPGSYSLRTLDFLKNLSQQEAESIAKLAQFVVGNNIYKDDATLRTHDVSFKFLKEMQDLGVISGVESLGVNVTWPSLDSSKFIFSLTSNSMVLVVRGDDPSNTFSMPVYPLTAIGRQVFSLGKFDSNIEYLKEVAEHIKKQGMSVSLSKFVRTSPTTIRPFEVQEL